MGQKAIKEAEESTEKLAENLNVLLKNHHLTIAQLAQNLSIPVMTIRRLISGETADPRISTLKLIADYFKVPVDLLIAGNPLTLKNYSNSTKPQLLPILDWNMAEKMSNLKKVDMASWKEWQPISVNGSYTIGQNTFALESRPSMYPRFPHGTVFIIDPDTTPNDGDVVLVKIKKNNEITLRELVIDPPDWQLHPITPGSTILPFNKQNYEIIGVNLLTLLYNRRMQN